MLLSAQTHRVMERPFYHPEKGSLTIWAETCGKSPGLLCKERCSERTEATEFTVGGPPLCFKPRAGPPNPNNHPRSTPLHFLQPPPSQTLRKPELRDAQAPALLVSLSLSLSLSLYTCLYGVLYTTILQQ